MFNPDQTEWPSKARLETLREEGIVPYSRLSTSCAGVVGVMFGLAVVRKDLINWYGEYFSSEMDISTTFGYLSRFPVTTFILPVLFCALFCFGWGFFQTKFLFRWSNLTFSFGKLMNAKLPNLGKILQQVVALCLTVFSFLAASVVVYFFSLRESIALLNHDIDYLFKWMDSNFIRFGPIFLFLFVLIGAFSWVIVRYKFMMKHRMSRQELIEEGNE